MNTLRLVFASLAVLAWAASVAVFLINGKAVDPWVHIIAAAMATALFGPDIWHRKGRGNGPG